MCMLYHLKPTQVKKRAVLQETLKNRAQTLARKAGVQLGRREGGGGGGVNAVYVTDITVMLPIYCCLELLDLLASCNPHAANGKQG